MKGSDLFPAGTGYQPVQRLELQEVEGRFVPIELHGRRLGAFVLPDDGLTIWLLQSPVDAMHSLLHANVQWHGQVFIGEQFPMTLERMQYVEHLEQRHLAAVRARRMAVMEQQQRRRRLPESPSSSL